jgi:glycosyltransferase involved in cell wall biosynthesis
VIKVLVNNKISVVIPAYNEEKNIKKTIERVKRTLNNLFDYEIIVVDDGSKDNTYQAAKEMNVVCIKHKKNMGKGAAFKTGLYNVHGGIVVQIDADSQFLPEEIPKIIKPIVNNDADLVLASRFIKNAHIERESLTYRNRIGNYVASFLTSIACMRKITDIQAGFKAFKSSCLKQINFNENKFGYEPEVVIKASLRRFRIQEMPILYKKRRKGQSSISFIKDAYNISKTILKAVLFPL